MKDTDKAGVGDHDTWYQPGTWRQHLTDWQYCRLILFRLRLLDDAPRSFEAEDLASLESVVPEPAPDPETQPALPAPDPQAPQPDPYEDGS